MAAMNFTSLELARALGGNADRYGCTAPGPGHGPNDRSMSVRLSGSDPDGFLVNTFSQRNDWRECRDYVKAKLGIERRPEPTRRSHRTATPTLATPTPSADSNKRCALALWHEALDPRGSPVERYLAGRPRALALPDDMAGRVIRWHTGKRAMIALFRDIITDEPCAISRTFLDGDARKTGRRFLGPTANAAMKLSDAEDVTHGLHIGEGIETCLSALADHDLAPVWALGDAGSVTAFPVLSGVETLTVIEDQDDAGRAATEICGQRWHDAGRQVLIARPPDGSTDFNDVPTPQAAA